MGADSIGWSALMRFTFPLALTLAVSGSAMAQAPQDFLAAFATEAKQADPGFSAFSASRGEAFFRSRHGGDWSCSTCHTDNPAAVGKHAVTGKRIEPLVPAANPERFIRPEKVDKWFRRNCNDVLKRACTAAEKGDVLTYLLSLGR